MRVLSMLLLLVPLSSWADGCDGIRQSLAKLPASGGEVIVAGKHECAAPILLDRDQLSLRGMAGATLRLADNANSPLLVLGSTENPPRPVNGVAVKNISLDGNRTRQSQECWGGPCGKASLRNHGIVVRGVRNGQLKTVTVTSARAAGVAVEDSVALAVDGLTVSDSEANGLSAEGTSGSLFNHMDLSGNGAAGIALGSRFRNNSVRNTRLISNRGPGLTLADASDNRFETLTIEYSGGHGAFVAAGAPDTCSFRNEFYNLTVSGAEGYGFWLNDECDGNRLSGVATFRRNAGGCYREPSPGRLGISAQLVCEP